MSAIALLYLYVTFSTGHIKRCLGVAIVPMNVFSAAPEDYYIAGPHHVTRHEVSFLV